MKLATMVKKLLSISGIGQSYTHIDAKSGQMFLFFCKDSISFKTASTDTHDFS